MWVYKVRYFVDDEMEWRSDEGIVAGKTIADCYKNLEEYYGDSIEALHIYAMESEENVLSFEDCQCGLTVKNFVKDDKIDDEPKSMG